MRSRSASRYTQFCSETPGYRKFLCVRPLVQPAAFPFLISTYASKSDLAKTRPCSKSSWPLPGASSGR